MQCVTIQADAGDAQVGAHFPAMATTPRRRRVFQVQRLADAIGTEFGERQAAASASRDRGIEAGTVGLQTMRVSAVRRCRL